MATRQRRQNTPAEAFQTSSNLPNAEFRATREKAKEKAKDADLRRIAFETARGSPETESYLGLGKADRRKRRRQLRPEPDFMDGVLQAILSSLGDDRGFGLSGTFLGGGL